MRFLKRVWIWFDDVTGISAAIEAAVGTSRSQGA